MSCHDNGTGIHLRFNKVLSVLLLCGWLTPALSALELSADRLSKNGAYWFEVSSSGRYVAYLGDDGYRKGPAGEYFSHMGLFLLDLDTGETRKIDEVGTHSETGYIEDMRFAWDDSVLCYITAEDMKVQKRAVFDLKTGSLRDVAIANTCIWRVDNTLGNFDITGASAMDSGEISPEKKFIIGEANGYLSEEQAHLPEAGIQNLGNGMVRKYRDIFSPVWGASDNEVYYLSKKNAGLSVNILTPLSNERKQIYTMEIPKDPSRQYWRATQKYIRGTREILLIVNLSAFGYSSEGEGDGEVAAGPGDRFFFYLIDPLAGKGPLFFQTQSAGNSSAAGRNVGVEVSPGGKFAIVGIDSVGIYKFDLSKGTAEKISLYCQELGPAAGKVKIIDIPEPTHYPRQRPLKLFSDSRAVTNYGGAISLIRFDDETGLLGLKAAADAQNRPETRPVEPSCALFAGSTRYFDLGDEGGVQSVTISGDTGVVYQRVFDPPVLSTRATIGGLKPGKYEMKSSDIAGNGSTFCFEILDLDAEVSLVSPPNGWKGYFNSHIRVAIKAKEALQSLVLIREGELVEMKEGAALTNDPTPVIAVKLGILSAAFAVQVTDVSGNCVQRSFTLKRRLGLGKVEISNSSLSVKRMVYKGDKVGIALGNGVFSTFEGVSRPGEVLLDLGNNPRVPAGYITPVNRTFTLTLSSSLAFRTVHIEIPYSSDVEGKAAETTIQVMRLEKTQGEGNKIIPTKLNGGKLEINVTPEELGTFVVVMPAVQRAVGI